MRDREANRQFAELDRISAEQLAAARVGAGRSVAGLSQEALATAMNLRGFQWRQTTVSKIEAGTRPLGFIEAIAFSEIAGVSLDSLAGRESLPSADTARALAELHSLAEQIDRRIAALS